MSRRHPPAQQYPWPGVCQLLFYPKACFRFIFCRYSLVIRYLNSPGVGNSGEHPISNEQGGDLSSLQDSGLWGVDLSQGWRPGLKMSPFQGWERGKIDLIVARELVGCWMLNVECWMFVFLIYYFEFWIFSLPGSDPIVNEIMGVIF